MENTSANSITSCLDPCGAMSSRHVPAADWAQVLDGLLKGDATAHVQVTDVILALIARARAFDLEPLTQDICLDVLAAVTRSLRGRAIRDPRCFVGYCATIVRHALAWRGQQIRRERDRDAGLEAAELAAPERRADDVELRIDLLRALEALPEKTRTVIRAIYLEGRSYGDAARELGVPLGSLKRMQIRGLCLLRERIDPELR